MVDNNDDQKLKRFGKYLILDHLSSGGMAKICRARYLGDKASKIVAIKMVQSKFSKDENFRHMFEEEVKVIFGLLHPNIVQTYDYGMNHGQLYVAMEYCDGKNLKEYVDKLKDKKAVFPIHIITYIISEACKGLHYAHSLSDKLTGNKCNIIHRDISPHNIMLTYDGTVKIIDFGIAKTQNTNSEATQIGTIKGKLSYLAPEYLEGKPLDGRYDQFAVGITMWEMLCGRKLFKADNDLAILKKVQECKIPAPSSINPNVHPDLDRIVLKALSKNRDNRYPDMTEFNRDLIKFLFSQYPDFNPSDLSVFAKSLFKEEIETDRKHLHEYGKIDIAPYLDELQKENQNGVDESPDKTETNTATSTKNSPRVLDFGFEEKTKTAKKLFKGEKTAQKDVNQLNIGPGAPKPTNKPFIKTKSAKSEQTSTNINRNDIADKKSSSSHWGLGTIAVALAIFFFAGDKIKPFYHKYLGEITSRGPSSNKDIGDEAQQEVTIELIGFNNESQRVFVDGKEVKIGVLNEFKSNLKTFVLRVQTIGREHFTKHINVTSDQNRLSITVPEMPAAVYGHLRVGEKCVDGQLEFELFGEDRSETIVKDMIIGFPMQITPDGQTHETEHVVHLRRQGLDVSQTIRFKLSAEHKSVYLCELISH